MSLTYKVMFCFENSVDTAAITASSEASADMEVENLQSNFRADSIWRSVAEETPGVEEALEITLDDTEGVSPVAMLIIADLNLSGAGNVLIEAWESAFDDGAPLFSLTRNIFGSLYGFGSVGNGMSGFGGGAERALLDLVKPGALFDLGGWFTFKCWRITLTDSNSLYVEASRIYLGSYWQPENNFAAGAVREVLNRRTTIESIGGQEYSDNRRGRVSINAVTKDVREGDADYLWVKYLEHGTTTPFFVCFRPTERMEQLFTTLWAKFKTNRVTQISFDNYEADIGVLEWM